MPKVSKKLQKKAPKKSKSPAKIQAVKPQKVSLLTRLNVRLSSKEKVLFAKYIAVLLESGLPLADAIDILQEQAKGSTKKILKAIASDVKNGKTMADGLARFPHIFSNIFINLIRAGEGSGTLLKNLEYLSEQMQKQYELKQSIRGAMMYPMIVLVGGLSVSALIVIFIFPNIIALFDSLDVVLPWTTRTVIFIATFFESYPVPIVATLVGIAVFVVVTRMITVTKGMWDHVMLRVPLIGSLLRNSVLSNIFRLLGTLLSSGLPLQESIRITNTTISSKPFKILFNQIETEVSNGAGLSDELAKHPFLVPPLAQRLVHVGSETGSLGKMLMYLADFYVKEVDEASKRIATLMEPFLIISMGILIGFIALSVISPIYSVVNNI